MQTYHMGKTTPVRAITLADEDKIYIVAEPRTAILELDAEAALGLAMLLIKAVSKSDPLLVVGEEMHPYHVTDRKKAGEWQAGLAAKLASFQAACAPKDDEVCRHLRPASTGCQFCPSEEEFAQEEAEETVLNFLADEADQTSYEEEAAVCAGCGGMVESEDPERFWIGGAHYHLECWRQSFSAGQPGQAVVNE